MRPPHATGRLALALALTGLLGVPCPARGEENDAERIDRDGYDLHCALCHGEDGSPIAALEKVLETEIPQLGSSRIQASSDDELREVILEGSGKMNPVISIDASEIAGVIAFVRTLKEE